MIKKRFNGTLIVNDKLNLINYADGLHLGQEDLAAINSNSAKAIEQIRLKIGNKILGLSTHNLQEIKEANSLDIDYIGLGAFRESSTKKDAKYSGETLLDIAKESKKKVALIGGVKLSDNFDNYPQIYYRVIGSDLMRNYKRNIN